ncbi:uncharacterized protein EV154DRAFT_486650 [Mucor mucedo]|uniref:uncharacterized protein n=1 Tax=Mucor mucedo TaxID=29922 RepID=UPI00221FF1B6|nr:uncharacterized protein EV154DRAFT_486650 [Mucor mucedo]KAI7875730.1 hypothetical protein EV154DRAFT_486650 [Mucor mucedo]
MSIQNIPQEILTQIFYSLDRKDVYISMFVCKMWYFAALPSYFQKVNYLASYTPKQLFGYGYLIKELTLNWEDPQWYKREKECFVKILSYAPNLKKLDFSTNYHCYIEILDFLLQLPDANRYLRHIEEIVYGKYWMSKTNHFLVCYNARKSIKRMKLFVSGEDVSSERKIRLLDYLPHFTSLTRLDIEYVKSSDLTIFDISLCCENLTELIYVNKFPTSSHLKNHVSTKRNKHLTRLTITSRTDSIHYFNYIRTVVDQLEYLDLNFGYSDESNIFPLIEQFAEQLSNIKNLNIIAEADGRPDIRLIQTKAFYNTLLKLRGNSDLRYDATITSVGRKDQITISNSKSNLSYGITIPLCPGFKDKHGIIKSLNFPEGNRVSLMDILSFAKGFQNHETLYVQFGCFHFMASKTAISVSSNRPSQKLLDQIHETYPNAETIIFSREENFRGRILGTTWDLTSFKRLNNFSFDANHICVKDYDSAFLKFDYGGFHSYKRVYFNGDGKKNIPVTVEELSKPSTNTMVVTIKVCSQLVEIHCNANEFLTVETVSF